MKFNEKTHQYECVKYSSADLFSLLNQSKLKQVNTYKDVCKKLTELKQDDTHKEFFEN